MNNVSIKNTPARTAIKEFLSISVTPVDVDQILKFLRSENLNTNKVTVYRILEFMLENGFVNRLEFGEGKYRYELQKDDHHHLICTDCGRITDIEDKFMEKIEEEILIKKRFLVKSHSLEFFGLCNNCLDNKN